MRTLFNVVTQIPTYIHLTEKKVHDVNAITIQINIAVITYCLIAFYVFY